MEGTSTAVSGGLVGRFALGEALEVLAEPAQQPVQLGPFLRGENAEEPAVLRQVADENFLNKVPALLRQGHRLGPVVGRRLDARHQAGPLPAVPDTLYARQPA